MAELDYQRRLSNLQGRRFDSALNESLVTKLFSDTSIPESLRYLVESMKPIPKKTTDKTWEAAERVQKHLEGRFNLAFNRAYRPQGSVMSDTHIKVSDCDFLTIIDSYYYRGRDVPSGNPYKGDPVADITLLREQAVKILKNTYDHVDDSHNKCISIINKALNRKVDIVFGYWYNTKIYHDSKEEYYRGIKFSANQPVADFPFAHIWKVNQKGDETNDGSRMGIRLLKTLKDDCENSLNELTSFHLTTIVHSIDNRLLLFKPGSELQIAKAISAQLQTLMGDPTYRKNIKSPNGIEYPLESDKLIPNLKIIKSELDSLVDTTDQFAKNSHLSHKFQNN